MKKPTKQKIIDAIIGSANKWANEKENEIPINCDLCCLAKDYTEHGHICSKCPVVSIMGYDCMLGAINIFFHDHIFRREHVLLSLAWMLTELENND